MIFQKNQKLNEKFIRKFQDKVDWINISFKQKLSINFIREFQDKVYWDYISEYQKLSEDFIREFQDKVYWSYISEYQKLSEKFIREFQDKVDWDLLLYKYGYNLYIDKDNFDPINDLIKSNTYIIKSVNNNYCSDYLEYSEFVNLSLRLISLKAFQ